MNKDSYGITYYQDITFVSSVPLLFLFFKLTAPGIPRWPLIQVPPRPIPAYPEIRRHQVWSFKSQKCLYILSYHLSGDAVYCISISPLGHLCCSSYLLAYAICMSRRWRSSKNPTELLAMLYIYIACQNYSSQGRFLGKKISIIPQSALKECVSWSSGALHSPVLYSLKF